MSKAKEKIIRNKIHFKYISLNAFQNFDFNNFISMLENGLIRYDHRWGVYRSGKNKGKPHNHGGGFRIQKSKIKDFFFTKL
ncbi:MAG: hypothetical protein GDA46_01790 [Bdellovibrionales bacterium]|nr:hypothetical protein [Bdellovibrionales bacterium]